jgi:serine/threonine protein kinase SCH9
MHSDDFSSTADKLLNSKPSQELQKLTLGTASKLREKNSPPQPSRASIYDGEPGGPPSPWSSAGTSTHEDEATIEGLPTITPKGELAVRIAAGRYLKPSYDPYVVCIFEGNEYISKGPKQDPMELDHDDRKWPIPSSASIPKSIDEDKKAISIVTNLQWNDEAVL